MKEFQTRYAMNKLLPEMTTAGCVIKTPNHEIELTAQEARKLRKSFYGVLKSRLDNGGAK